MTRRVRGNHASFSRGTFPDPAAGSRARARNAVPTPGRKVACLAGKLWFGVRERRGMSGAPGTRGPRGVGSDSDLTISSRSSRVRAGGVRERDRGRDSGLAGARTSSDAPTVRTGGVAAGRYPCGSGTGDGGGRSRGDGYAEHQGGRAGQIKKGLAFPSMRRSARDSQNRYLRKSAAEPVPTVPCTTSTLAAGFGRSGG